MGPDGQWAGIPSCLEWSMYEGTGASCEYSKETDIARSHLGSAIISKSFPEPIFAIKKGGRG